MLESLELCWFSFDIWARDKNDFSIKILAWVGELHSMCPENKLTTNTFYAGIFNPFHHMNSLREETSDSSGTFWTGLSKFHFMSLIEFFEENQFSGNFRSFSWKFPISIRKTYMFLSENIFKTLSKLQYISLDQHFAGTLFLWEPYNNLRTISDCEQKNLNSGEYYPPRNSKLLSLSLEKLSDRKALFWIFSIFFRLRPKTWLQHRKFRLCFQKCFFCSANTLGKNRFAEKHTNLSVLGYGAEKEMIAAETLSSKVSKLLCPCPDDIFAKNSFSWLNYIGTISFSLWDKKNFGL